MLVSATLGCGGAQAAPPASAVVAPTVAEGTTLDLAWPAPPTRTEQSDPEAGTITIDTVDSGGARYLSYRIARIAGVSPEECLDDVRAALVMSAVGSTMTSGEERDVLGDARGSASRGFTMVSPRATLWADAYVLRDAVVRVLVFLPAGTTRDPAAEAFLRSAHVH
jgi:hypothetical protein